MPRIDCERYAEQALLAEHVARQAAHLGHSCHLATMATRRRDNLLHDLTVATGISLKRLHEAVRLHETGIADGTMRVGEAAALVANMRPSEDDMPRGV